MVVFEDDMMPSRNFFSFVKVCTEKYVEMDNIAGISLYTHCINFTTGDRFIPIACDGDRISPYREYFLLESPNPFSLKDLIRRSLLTREFLQ